MKTFFLEGDKFVGKSTLLQKIIQETETRTKGFYVKRRLNQQNEIIGFELKDASELLSSNLSLGDVDEHCFIKNEEGIKSRNLTVFEEFGCSLLKEAKKSNQVILLDEIGGIELLAKKFEKELFELFDQPQKIIGVFKSEKNYQQQKQNTTDRLEVDQQRDRLRAIIRKQGIIVELTPKNRFSVEKQLHQFLLY